MKKWGACFLIVLILAQYVLSLFMEFHDNVWAETLEMDRFVMEEKDDDEANEPITERPELYIKSLNPGFTVDGVRDVGEFIELERSSEEIVDLTGYELRYLNTSQKEIELYKFADGAMMREDNIILRLKRVAEENTYDDIYSTSMALAAGPLLLLKDDEVVDQVCWTGKDDCADSFQSKAPTTLVWDDGWRHDEKYSPIYNDSLVFANLETEDDEVGVEGDNTSESFCEGAQFTEVYTYYENNADEQFIEIQNLSMQDIYLENCQILYKNKKYNLSGIIAPGGYLVIYPTKLGFALTKNPTKTNEIQLIDINGNLIDSLVYANGQKKNSSYALIIENGVEEWRQTFAKTPGGENIYQQYRSCLEGYEINPTTGNCIKIKETIIKTCPEGQVLNPLTNRCRKEAVETVKTCKEGYELNPETNRCRKKTEPNTGADYVLTPNTSGEQKSFVGFGIVIAIVVVGVGYVIFQFRYEIKKGWHKLRHKIGK